MIDVVGAICNTYLTAMDDATVALRQFLDGTSEPLTIGKMFADFEPESTTPVPYIAVSEDNARPEKLGFNNSYRIDRVTIDFGMYCKNRSDVIQLVALLDKWVSTVSFATYILGFPEFESRKVFWMLNHYAGLFTISFLVNQCPTS